MSSKNQIPVMKKLPKKFQERTDLIYSLIQENSLDIEFNIQSGYYTSANKDHMDLLRGFGVIYNYEIDDFTTTLDSKWAFFVRFI